MSKRGRRRSSRRRKSSSSSKQSVSPYIFHKQNNISYKDHVVEKGEADSLRKENAPSGSEDEEKNNNAPPKEKRFKQDCDISSVSNQKSIYMKTMEDAERGVKITTSVSVDDDSNPKITFQQSHQPLTENQTNPSPPITNIMSINCSGSNIKLEIQEFLHTNTPGIRTTFVFMNQGMNSDHQRTWTPNNESHHLTNQSSNYTFVFGDQPAVQRESISPSRTWFRPDVSHRPQSSEFMLENPPCVTPPPVFGTKPLWKRKQFQRSYTADEFWDIPPPREFADIRQNLLEELTQDLSSCRISDEPHMELHPPQEYFTQLSSDELAGRSPSFDQESELESYDPSLTRPSLSTNRSSFTKDFISGQQGKFWIRNNSIAAVQHQVCSIPKKRRQTYPGTSEGLIQDQDLLMPCSESFFSLMMNPGSPQKSHLAEDGISGSLNSLQTRMTPKEVWDILNGQGLRPSLIGPIYQTSSEDAPDDAFTIKEEDGGQCTACYNPHQRDLMCRVCRAVGSMDNKDRGHKVDHSDIADSGFDQEMGEMDYQMGEVEDHSVDPPTEEEEEQSRRSLMIQVIPPSCSGSEEHILEGSPTDFFHCQVDNANQLDSDTSSPGLRRSSDKVVPAGVLQQRLLQVDSRLSPSTCLDTYYRTSSGDSSMDSLNTHQETEHTKLDKPRNICPSESAMAEETENQPSGSASSLIAGSPESKEQLSQTCSVDKHMASKSPLEAKEHLKLVVHKEDSGSDHWAKRRKLFRESKQWSSAAGSSITSDVTEESVQEWRVSEDTLDGSIGDSEDKGFYTETFHSSAWIFQGDDVSSGTIPPSLNTRTRAVSIRERTVRISKGIGEYPWGFRIQFSKPIVVTEVDTNGAAEEASLIVGDYVLAVNGTDVTSIPHSEAADLARQGPDILTLTVGSDIARCPNTPRPACRGYLHKRTQSGLIKGWRKRWFVLTHDCCLYYYRHKRDEGKRRALAAVKMEGAEVGPDVSLGKPFVFKCQPQNGNRVFFFCATSNQEMKRWLEAMERAVHPITQKHVWVDVTRHNSMLPPLAVKNPECLGLLHKMDRSRDMWVQHYCILKDGCLFLYSGIRATHARGGIYLQGYQVREQPFGSKKSTIELKPPCDEFKTFYLCAEDPTENKRWIIALKGSIKKWLPLHQALQDYMSRLPEETRM